VVDQTREHLHFAGDDFAPCTLTDLSMDGAGLELGDDVDTDVSVGDCVELDLRLGADRLASIKVRGEVRHTTPVGDGTPRAGLEFVQVGDLERALLLRLLRDLEHAGAKSA
jgi:hypothetical protein